MRKKPLKKPKNGYFKPKIKPFWRTNLLHANQSE